MTTKPNFQDFTARAAAILASDVLCRTQWTGSWRSTPILSRILDLPRFGDVMARAGAGEDVVSEALAMLATIHATAKANDDEFKTPRYRIAYRTLLIVADPEAASSHLDKLTASIASLISARQQSRPDTVPQRAEKLRKISLLDRSTLTDLEWSHACREIAAS